MRPAERLLERLDGVRPTGEGRWEARCPGHDDRKPSLSVTEKPSEDVLVHCHAGCDLERILGPIDLEPKELFAEQNGHRELVTAYDYTDEAGELLFQVCRFAPKDFRQRRPDGNEWSWSLGDTRRVLYRLPRVVAAVERGEDVLIAEGEKDVHALEELGIVATTNPMGAGKWRDEYSETLRGATVTIVADRDEAGHEHARRVASSLEGVARTVDVVEPTRGKDMAAHLAAGGTVAELAELVARDESVTGEVTQPDAGELLEGVESFTRRYVVMSDSQAAVVALWVLHTHAVEAAEATPYLAVTSAEKRSGKSRLLEALTPLVRAPLSTSNISDAALFRSLSDPSPTLLFDEVDAIFGPKARDREDLRCMLNAGHRRGAEVRRCVGDGSRQRVESFPVFCAKVLAGIGTLPDTIADRSVPIRLERRAPGEQVERFRRREAEAQAEALRVQVEQYAGAHIEQLERARPDLPLELDDRAQDAAEPLLAIADLAGGEWPLRARTALVELCGAQQLEDESIGVRLLADVRQVFADEERLSSADLCDLLNALDESPWAEWYGKPLGQRGLAKLLKPYGIGPHSIQFPDGKARGYTRKQFSSSWSRYLPPPKRSGVPRGSVEPKTADSDAFHESPRNACESGANPHEEWAGNAGTDSTPNLGAVA